MKYLMISLLLLPFFSARGQENPNLSKEALEKIEAARIALLTERLGLTPKQAEKFWPIYREFGAERKLIRQDFDQARRNFNPNQASEDENKRMLDMATRVKEQQLTLEKEYAQRLLKVISTRQLNNLRKAEDDFKEMLLQRIRAEQLQRRQMRQQNGERLRDRRN